MAGSFGSALSMFGGAVGDFYTAKGDRAIAQGDYLAGAQYGYAANIADANENLSKLSTQIQLAQTDRKINQTIGSEQAGIGAANLGPGGSAGDLLRSSVQQGALSRQLVSTQGAMNANAFEEQATAYRAMRTSALAASDAADQAAKGADIGAVFKLGAGALSLFGV